MFTEIAIKRVTSNRLSKFGYRLPSEDNGWYCLFGRTSTGSEVLLTTPVMSLHDLACEMETLTSGDSSQSLRYLKDEIHKIRAEFENRFEQLESSQRNSNKTETTVLIRTNVVIAASGTLAALAATYSAFQAVLSEKADPGANVKLSYLVLGVERLRRHRNHPDYDGKQPGYLWNLKLKFKNKSRENIYLFNRETLLYNSVKSTPVFNNNVAVCIFVPARDTLELHRGVWLAGPKPEHRVGRVRYAYRGIWKEKNVVTFETPWIRLRRSWL